MTPDSDTVTETFDQAGVEPAPAVTQGRIEIVEDGAVRGWAWRPSMPEHRVQLRVLLDGEELGTAVAELPRPSLAVAGIGDGRHAFRFQLPDPSPGRSAFHLRVEAAPGQPLTPASAFTVTVAAESRWSGIRFAVDHPGGSGYEPPIDGRIESVAGGVIDGWAWLPAMPDERLRLRVLLDDEEVGTTVADLPRPSLAAEGIGDGQHAFRFGIPEDRAHPGRRTVRVELDGDPVVASAHLHLGEAERSDDSWYGARFTIDSLAAAPAPGDGRFALDARSARPAGPRVSAAAAQPSAVLGSDGWLFAGDAAAAEIEPSRTAVTETAVAELLERLSLLAARLHEMDVKLLPVLIPTKEYIYRQFLPEGLWWPNEPRPCGFVVRGLLDHPTLEALDLLPALEAGAERWAVYAPALPRLSEWGAYCAYRATVKRVAAIIAAVPPPVELGEGKVVTVPARRWPGPVVTVSDGRLVPCSPGDVPTAPPEPVVIVPPGEAEPTPLEHLGRLKASLALGWEQLSRRELPRALFVGEHTHSGLVEWVGRHFRYTVLIGTDAPLVDLVSLERPDIVVYLVEERVLLEAGGE